MRTSARRAFAIAASVIALATTIAIPAASAAPEVRPNAARDCDYGHQHQVYGGEAWAHCTGGSGSYRIGTFCRQPDGRLTPRWGTYRTVPSPSYSRVNCLPAEMPVDSSVEGSSDPGTPRRPCRRSELPVPAGTDDSFVEATDPSDRYQVGYSIDTSDRWHLLQWENGELTDLTGGEYYVKPRDINASGEIIGFSSESRDDWSAWRYRDGEFIELRTRRPYTDPDPIAINDAGQIAGRLGNLDPNGGTIPVVWSADNRLTQLAIPAGWERVTIKDIDEDGTVLGHVFREGDDPFNDEVAPIVWAPDGTWRLLTGPEPNVETRAAAIRAGKVLGRQGNGYISDGIWPLIYLWDAKTGEPTLSTAIGSPTGLNARGSIIGFFTGTWGEGFLAPGETDLRPLPMTNDTDPGDASLLTDNDVAYGNDIRRDRVTFFPARWDCSV